MTDLFHYSFCDDHSSLNPEDQESLVLHRDMLHAMIMPVVQLFQQASTLAGAALCSHKPEDLELAFRGEARDAFVWLQVFLSEEEKWCHTQGCPGCVVANTLSSESTIRVTITAALLSSTEPATPNDEESPIDFDCQGPTLPDLSAAIPSLSQAVGQDEFWGPALFEHLFERAERTFLGIQDLIYQCTNLEALVLSQPSSPSESPTTLRRIVTMPCTSTSPTSTSPVNAGNQGPVVLTSKVPKQEEMKLRKGKWARRQSSLKHEERALILKATSEAFVAQQQALLAQAKQQPWSMDSKGLRLQMRERGKRRRTLTCP